MVRFAVDVSAALGMSESIFSSKYIFSLVSGEIDILFGLMSICFSWSRAAVGFCLTWLFSVLRFCLVVFCCVFSHA